MIDGFQLRARATRFQIPLIYGVDAVHGHNNLVGATIMPHNIGIGATRDPRLARADRRGDGQLRSAPPASPGTSPPACASPATNAGAAPTSPSARTRRSSSPWRPSSRGLQGRADGRDLKDDDKVLATAKHFVGDGGTAYGSSTTGRRTPSTRASPRSPARQLEAVHLAPYRTAVDRGIGTVMPSYSSLDVLGDGRGPVKMHARADMINGVLKDRMGFDGLRHQRLERPSTSSPATTRRDVRTSVNAGVDMMMVPYGYKDFTVDADRRGEGRARQRQARSTTPCRASSPEVPAGPVRAPVRRHARRLRGSAPPRTGPSPARRPPSRRCC